VALVIIRIVAVFQLRAIELLAVAIAFRVFVSDHFHLDARQEMRIPFHQLCNALAFTGLFQRLFVLFEA